MECIACTWAILKLQTFSPKKAKLDNIAYLATLAFVVERKLLVLNAYNSRYSRNRETVMPPTGLKFHSGGTCGTDWPCEPAFPQTLVANYLITHWLHIGHFQDVTPDGIHYEIAGPLLRYCAVIRKFYNQLWRQFLRRLNANLCFWKYLFRIEVHIGCEET